MDLLLDPEQELVVNAIRDLLDSKSPPGRLRDLGDDDPVADPALLKLATAQGWFGLDVPAELGGAGLSLGEQSLLFREIGRHLTAGPYLGTAIAVQVAARADDSVLVGRIIRGDLRFGLCEPVVSTPLNELIGQRVTTFDRDDAQAFVCVTPEGSALFDLQSVSLVQRRTCIDPASHVGELIVTGGPILIVSNEAFGAIDYGRILVSAMLSGIAEATAHQSVEYAKVRVQFGVPIGSFQTIQRRCAEQAVRASAASDLVTLAALTLRDGLPNGGVLASSAALIASKYALENCADNIQNHGGIGYTFEHDAHLYLKRTHVLSLTLGDARDKRDAVLSGRLERS
jgi:alkylation response protein AidB-like acyl-CoA dehydrogenase